MNGHLTQHQVDHLVPKAHEQSFSDDAPEGLYIRVYPTGSKSYWLRYQLEGAGETRRMKIGDARDMTLRTARSLANAALDLADKGHDPNRSPRVQSPTVHDYLWHTYWHKHVRQLKPKTQADTNARIKRLHKRCPWFTKLRLDEVTRLHILDVQEAYRDTPVEANRVIALLSHAMTFAELHELRPDGSNPCRLVPRFKERARDVQLTPDELARVLVAIRAEGPGHQPQLEEEAGIVLELMLLTGMRRSEAVHLRWNAVVAVEDQLWLALPDSKTGPKRVPIAGRAEQVLKSWAKMNGIESEHSPMFPLLNKQPRRLERQWDRVRRAAGLSGLRIHDLRHAWATVASVQQSGSLALVGAALGHRSQQTTQGYVNPHANDVHELAGRTADAISEAGFDLSRETSYETD